MNFTAGFKKTANFMQQIEHLPSRVNIGGPSRKIGLTRRAINNAATLAAEKPVPRGIGSLPGQSGSLNSDPLRWKRYNQY